MAAQSQDSPPVGSAEGLKYFNPDEGFKPAQSSLTDIFRQLAASLEHHGHPGPYLRHIKAEHERIAEKYRQKLGKEMASYLPAYMTDDYIDDLYKNWDELAPNLKLEKLAKESGRSMRLAIDGENGKGTALVLLFNWHQERIYDEMVSGEKRSIGFQQLKDELMMLAKDGQSDFLARRETKLSPSEREMFQSLISKPRFTKAEFSKLEAFYEGPHDRLSEYGKSLLSQRVFAGQRGEDVPGSDAEKYSREFQERFEVLFGHLERGLPEETATSLKQWVRSAGIDLGRIAISEYEIAIRDWALRNR